MLIDGTPFPHQGPLAPDRVGGRDGLIADLVERVTARRMTALLGPRRFGKTSVLGAVAARLDDAGTSVVRLDLYETRSSADLVVRLDRALAASRGRVGSRLGSLALRISVNLGVLQVEFARPPAQRPDADASLDLLLDLLVEAASDEPTLLVVDEFTGIDGVAGA
jgi:MoxR-like ATPase